MSKIPVYEMVSFEATSLPALKEAYEKCAPGEVFIFEGHELLKEYARYLIEYLEMQFA